MKLTRQEYIKKYCQLAINATQGTGLFPSVMIAQGIVESNNGNSTLSSLYNNHFGIKADSSWTGKKVSLQTREVFDGKSVMIGDFFRVYNTVEEGFEDRIQFLKRNKRYTTFGVFNARTPLEQIEALKNAKYATDPLYVTILNQVLVKNNLAQYDTIKTEIV